MVVFIEVQLSTKLMQHLKSTNAGKTLDTHLKVKNESILSQQ